MVLNDILNLLKTDYVDDSENTTVELNELLSIVCHHLTSSARSKSIKINLGTTAPVHVLANKVLLAEALTNVVNNAIKFSYSGREINIHLEQKNSAATVKIIDYVASE